MGATTSVGVGFGGVGGGDGYDDVLVSVSSYDAGQENEGAVFVFLGSAIGVADATTAAPHARREADQAFAFMGSAAPAGDVDGDVLVGAPGYSAAQSGQGGAFVFFGSAAGIGDRSAATADFSFVRLDAERANAALGWSVAAGDFDGDGYSDSLVGAPFDEAAFAFDGKPTPACEVAMSQPSYTNGQAVVITSLRFHNTSRQSLETRLRLQLTLPFGITANALDLGAGGGFSIPANFDRQLGPVTMFTLQPGQPRGPFRWRCALEDPTTGEILAEDIAPFEFH